MLRTYEGLGEALVCCLEQNALSAESLCRHLPRYMSPMNRAFQEDLFESLLSFDSDDFRRLVHDLNQYPDQVVNDLVFADFDFGGSASLGLAADALLRPHGILGNQVLRSIARRIFGSGSA